MEAEWKEEEGGGMSCIGLWRGMRRAGGMRMERRDWEGDARRRRRREEERERKKEKEMERLIWMIPGYKYR
jgi:hypothetical protein